MVPQLWKTFLVPVAERPQHTAKLHVDFWTKSLSPGQNVAEEGYGLTKELPKSSDVANSTLGFMHE